MEKHPKIARQQFQILLERANKRFGKLRELQTRGDYSWPAAQSFFHKTFESFSRLWQFQLNNRAALLDAGLQRSDLGAIANKIGQLYYNYYLRSGDTGALLESYTFYDAVHTRQYFASTTESASDPAAAARQMRFYARFVVVCLFLHRREEAMQLMQELQASVSSYMLQYSSPDAQEWQLVVDEVVALLAADQLAMPVPRSPVSLEVPYTPPLRCRPTDPAATCAPHRPRLVEAILVSYRHRQVKVAELPLELYRMAQTLEWQQPQQQQQCPPPSPPLLPPPPQSQVTATATGGSCTAAASGAATFSQVTAAATAAPTGQFVECPSPQPPGRSPDVYENNTSEGAGGGGEGDATAAAAAAAGARVSQPPAAAVAPPQAAVAPAAAPPPSPATAAIALRPQQPSNRCVASPLPALATGRNPPRQLLHRPTAQHLLSALLTVTEGVDQAAAGEQFVLLYISADAAPQPPSPPLGGSFTAATTGEEAVHSRQRGNVEGFERGFPLLGIVAPPWQALSPATSLPGTAAASTSSISTTAATTTTAATATANATATATGVGPASVVEPCRYGSLTAMALSCPAQMLCAMVGQLDLQPQALQQLQDVLDDMFFQLGREMAKQLLLLPTTTASQSSSLQAQTPAVTVATAAAPPAATAASAARASGAAGDERDPPIDSMTCRVTNPVATTTAATSTATSSCSGAASSSPLPSPSPAAAAAASTLPYIAWSPVFEDCLARRLLLHFAFYRAVVHMHPRRNRNPSMAPSCFPPLPPAADPTSAVMRQAIRRAAEVAGRPGAFGSGE